MSLMGFNFLTSLLEEELNTTRELIHPCLIKRMEVVTRKIITHPMPEWKEDEVHTHTCATFVNIWKQNYAQKLYLKKRVEYQKLPVSLVKLIIQMSRNIVIHLNSVFHLCRYHIRMSCMVKYIH